MEDSLHVGDRVSLTCSVNKGDQPLTISWHKDGRSLEGGQLMPITQVDQFTSILVIESLSPEHNGNYSCVVRNLAAEVSHTHQLVVNGNWVRRDARPLFGFCYDFSFLLSDVCFSSLSVPPIIEPFSFQDGLSEGMRTRTVCGVSSGDPPLVVSWLKDGQPLTPSLGVNVSALDPYSSLLSISSLDSRHSGDFTCVASNPASEVRYTAKLQVKGNQPRPVSHPLRLIKPLLARTPPQHLPLLLAHASTGPPRSRYCCTLFCSMSLSLSLLLLLYLTFTK